MPLQNQQTRELISAQKTSCTQNKDLNTQDILLLLVDFMSLVLLTGH